MRPTPALFFLLFLSACAESLDKNNAELPFAEQTIVVELINNDTFQLIAGTVAKDINGTVLQMYAYNNQTPGPMLQVVQGSTIFVNFTNLLSQDTTIHWHGVRVDQYNDGVPQLSQKPIGPGESYLYHLSFPDAGIYWYHPHIREDMQQELGLYGNILVMPKDSSYYPPADKEVTLLLDDLRLANGSIVQFGQDYARFALMGRFGNIMLLEGTNPYGITLRAGEKVRFHFTNVANTRIFNVSIDQHRMKMLASDGGLYEKEFYADAVVLAPGERATVEVLFNEPGTYFIMHTTPDTAYQLGMIEVLEGTFSTVDPLREHTFFANLSVSQFVADEPDYILDMSVDIQGMDHAQKIVMHPIEWEDDMSMMNTMSTSQNTRWILRDRKSGKENMDIVYRLAQGSMKKIRLFNDPNSLHPMQHPIHIHGQRFLVLAIDGKPNEHLAWKDTVLVPAGSTVDILVDFSNPGQWMIHCHIAEHLESGMMAVFAVEE